MRNYLRIHNVTSARKATEKNGGEAAVQNIH